MDHMLPKRRFIHSIQQEALSSYQVHVQTCRRERRVLFLGLFGPAPSVAYASVFFQDSVDRVTVSRLFKTPGCWVWQAVCVQIQSQGSVSLGAFHWRRGARRLSSALRWGLYARSSSSAKGAELEKSGMQIVSRGGAAICVSRLLSLVLSSYPRVSHMFNS